MDDRIWTLSNGLSLLRVMLVVPVALLLHSGTPGSRLFAASLILVAALTDFLDGRIARMKDQVTRLGKILDPVADKVGINAVVLLLAAEGTLPVWFAVAVTGRDVAIIAAALYISRSGGGSVPQSNRTGKWAAAVMALTVFTGVIDPGDAAGLMRPCLGAAALMIVLSSISYAKRFSR